MLYQWYEFGCAAWGPARVAAESCRLFLHPLNPLSHTPAGRTAAAACEVFERATRRYLKPQFKITQAIVDGAAVAVSEEVVWQTPFCRVIHFKRDVDWTTAAEHPRLLLVAPMSGHFATLLRGTVAAFLPEHEVYITDWQDAGDVPLAEGRFDLDDYIDTMIGIFRFFAGDVHVFAVCQSAVPVLAATAIMEENSDPAAPRSLTLAGGPIDTRINKTAVNILAEQRGTDWFRRHTIATAPWTCAGRGRRVYPGFLQLSGFMSMNLDRHLQAHRDMFLHLVRGDGDSAAKHRKFYDEYLAVMDPTAEFFLQTVDTVFVQHLMPRGCMAHRGLRVNLSAMRNTALMTVEGEKDDITGSGQCKAALQLSAGIPAGQKQHFECPRVGHYGIFNGTRFGTQIAPRVAKFIRAHDPRTAKPLTGARRLHQRTAKASGLARQRRRCIGARRSQTVAAGAAAWAATAGRADG